MGGTVSREELDRFVDAHGPEAQLRQRIRQLEQLNAQLAAQVDRQARVVDAARLWNSLDRHNSKGRDHALGLLSDACDQYDEQMAELAKGGR